MNSKFFYIIPIIALFLFYESGLSQKNQDKQKKSYFQLRDKLPYQLKEQERLIEREFILEDAINAKEYTVGPGDVLAVYMWGQQENLYEVMVLPEGNIIIPSIGSIMINNMTLETAKELIIKEGNKYYPGAKITVSLTGIRRFKVHVSGEVLNRGSFDASPINRVSNVIAMAQGFTSWADKKNIEITHLDGTTDIFDLFQFERKGNISQNPFIRGGDIIYIPRIKLSEGMVFISGNVAKPGNYQFYKNEAISSLIERVNIEKETTDWENSFIKRGLNSTENEIINIPLDFIDSHDEDKTPPELYLKHSDIIYLPKKINEVYVFGAVRNPGAYPFRSNMKSVDYASLAGKTERATSNSNIKVIRKDSEKILKGPEIEVQRGDKIEVPIRTTEITKDYLQIVGTFTSILIAAKAVGIIK